MKDFKQVSIEQINVSASKLIGKDWMLITAGRDTASFNTMTASWGTLGYLWEKNVAVMFIRPQRYTKEFVDANEIYTLSFFDERYRNALKICGTKSGKKRPRKAQEAGLTPMVTTLGSVAFQEATMILECRKLYASPLDSDAFINHAFAEKFYPDNDFHVMYVGEIVNVYRK
ncbi:MAG: flavin reductase [Prevotellaceae bacterium]|jgi:flavin reductase (DIM6/NTAB) family NADH-FMN oxidoreductase RutF|nr:flavin reductase [Prevotellaceae bacterium]